MSDVTISERTRFPLSLIIVAIGFAGFLFDGYAQGQKNRDDIKDLKQERTVLLDKIDALSQRAVRIEASLDFLVKVEGMGKPKR